MASARLTKEGSDGPFWSQRRWWRLAGRASGALWVATALTFVGTALAARTLGPSQYGDVVLALAITGLIATLLDITLEEGVVHHGFKLIGAEEPGGLRPLLRAALAVDFGAGVIVATALVLFAPALADIVAAGESLDHRLVMAAAIVPLAGTIDGTTGGVLMLTGRADLRAWCQAAGHVARVVAIVVAVLAGAGPFGVIGAYALAAVVQTLVQARLAWRLAWRDWDRQPPVGTVRSWLRRLTSFGVHTSFTTTVQSGERSVVVILVGAFAGSTAAGYFSVAMLPLTIVAILSSPLRLMLFPEQAKLAADGEIGHLRTTVRAWTGIGLAIGAPCAAVAWIAMPWLVTTLFGPDFEGAVTPARIMLIAAVLHLAAGWSKTLPAAIGRPQLRSVLATMFLFVSVGVTAVLASEHGALAGALGNLAAIATLVVAWIVIIERVLRGVAPTATPDRAPATPVVPAAARPGPSAR